MALFGSRIKKIFGTEANIDMKLAKRARGASMVEYAIVIAIIAAAAVAGLTTFGDKLKGAFDTVGTKVTTETNK